MTKSRSRRFPKPAPARRPGLTLESLEKRNLLAPVINEVYVGDAASQNTDQYYEVRAEPNEVLADGTYLALIDSAFSFSRGNINAIFDLSGVQAGDNGLIVLAQQNSPHTIASGATLLQSDAVGFTGLSQFSSDSAPSSSESVFLFQTDVAPSLADDIDANNDGLVDPLITGSWNIHDSITYEGTTTTTVYGYGRTIFADRFGVQSQQPNSNVIIVDDFFTSGVNYVARQGNSSGSGASDWIGSFASRTSATEFRLGLEGNAATAPDVYSGRSLDHVGLPNFFGGVQGRVINGDTGTGVPNLTILADTNNNGQRDLITTLVDPGTFQPGQELTNAIPGMTITQGDFPDDRPEFRVEAEDNFLINRRVFGPIRTVLDRFDRDDPMRVDFYTDASSVSMDFTGADSIFSTATGSLEIYTRQGSLLAQFGTGQLAFGTSRTLSYTSPGDNIGYIIARGDVFGDLAFGNLVVQTLEPVAVTDLNGNYFIQNLSPDTFDVTFPPNNLVLRSPVGGVETVTVTTDNEHHTIDFEIGPNRPPTITGDSFVIAESAATNTVVGVANGVDPDMGQTLQYRVTGGTGSRVFGINPDSGEIIVANESLLDFETTASYTLEIEVADNFIPPLTDSATFEITLTDVNEAPTVPRRVFTGFAEDSQAGAVVGTVFASDADTGVNGEFQFGIADTNSGFSIDPLSGELRLIDPSVLDFETDSSVVLNVTATDNGSPARVGTGEIVIRLDDVNESPALTPATLSVSESFSSTDPIAFVPFFDPDNDQTHLFEITGGNADGVIELDPTTGALLLVDGASLDHETNAFFSLGVRVTDSGTPPLSISGNIGLSVLDFDERPVVDVNISTVPENSAPGTIIGNITANDPEGDSLQISLVRGGELFNFEFDPTTSTGTISVRDGNLNFEDGDTRDLLLLFEDRSSPPQSTSVPIEVTLGDVAEPPTILSTAFSIREGFDSIEPFAQVQVSDPDNDIESFAIVGGTGESLFDIDAVTGELTLEPTANLDFESITSYQLRVETTDASGLQDAEFIDIQVTNTNETPSIITPIENQRVQAARPFSFTFGDDLFTDPENDPLVITVESTSEQLPAWLNYDPSTRTLSGVPSNADIGANAVVVRVTDTGVPPLADTQAFTINVQQNAFPWQNPSDQFDVTDDGQVLPLDALSIINFINANGVINVPLDQDPPRFYDVNGDNRVSQLDAVNVLNRINAFLGQGAPPISIASGEAGSASVDIAIEELSSSTSHLDQVASSALALDFTAAFDSDEDENEKEAVDASLAEFLLESEA